MKCGCPGMSTELRMGNELSTDRCTVFIARGIALSKRGKYKGAAEAFQKALGLDPGKRIYYLFFTEYGREKNIFNGKQEPE